MLFLIILLTTLAPAQTSHKNWLPELIKINQDRETRAQGLLALKQISAEHFKSVCQPVSQDIQALAKKYQLTILPVTEKFRNPLHQANAQDQKALITLKEQGQQKPLYIDRDQTTYYATYTTSACLKCHGSAADIPEFIKNKYPQDLAFGYKPEDLRGAFRIRSK